ncbi:hypothetical protein ACWEQL_08535, partial [Kitasatospora sp. NPDC004240]
RWSDLAGSRTRPMRRLTLATAAVLAALAGAVALGSPLATAALIAAGVVTVSTNGLSFTAVAEHAGTSWAGRALGVHVTTQNALAAAVAPVMGAVITAYGYGPAYALTLAFPLAAALLVPSAGTGHHPAGRHTGGT